MPPSEAKGSREARTSGATSSTTLVGLTCCARGRSKLLQVVVECDVEGIEKLLCGRAPLRHHATAPHIEVR